MPRSRNLGYGEGSIYKEPETGRFRGELRINNKRQRVSGSTRAEVLHKLDALRSQVANGMPVDNDTRLGPWIDWYLEDVAAEKDPNTLSSYTWAASHLEPLRGRRLRDLEVADVEGLLRDLATGLHRVSTKSGRGGRQRALGRSSLVRVRMVLGAALYEAERLGKLNRNVARLARIPKEATAPSKRRSLEVHQAQALAEATKGQPGEALILVGLTLGLRPGEVLGLPWDAVDLKAGTLEVRQSLKRLPDSSLVIGPTKADSDRTIRLPERLIDVLHHHRQAQRRERLSAPVWEDHDLVFPNALGRPIDPSNLRRTVQNFADMAGVGHLSPNELRHSAASLLVDVDTPIPLVADMLGHNSLRMLTQTYRHKTQPVVDVTEGQDRMLLG